MSDTLAPRSTQSPTAPAQPRGLRVLFLTEMWERFSYYGNQALLVLYLVHALGQKESDALSTYGTYTMLLFIAPLLGGWLADKILGLRLSAVIGSVVMMLGHFAMAVPWLLHVALGLLVVGNGLFKPCTSAMVGELYDGPDDSRRDAGYTVFYMGINVGGILATLVCGTLGETVGWHVGFASAGVGMAIGLLVLVVWQRLLGRAGLLKSQLEVGGREVPIVLAWTAGIVATVGLGVFMWPRVEPWIVQAPAPLLILGGLGAALALFASWRHVGKPAAGVEPLTALERARVSALAIVIVFMAFFFVCAAQAGGSMSLFADKLTDRLVGGHLIPATLFQAINPLLVLILAPLFSRLWTRLNKSPLSLPDTAKIGLGMVVVGLGFVVMTIAQSRAELQGRVGPQWLVGAYALQTVGEVMLAPIALALVSRVTPERIAGVVMGAFMLTSGVANKIAGSLNVILDGSGFNPYFVLASISIACGLALTAMSPMLTQLFAAGRKALSDPAPRRPLHRTGA